MKKVFFFDIDGTLVYENKGKIFISNENVKAIKSLKKQGYKIFIATGRTESFIPLEILNLPIDGLISANGSVVRIGNKIIYEKFFPQTAIDKILNFCKKYNHDYLFEGQYAYVKNLKSKNLDFFYDNVIINKDKIIVTNNLYDVVIYNALVLGKNINTCNLQQVLGDKYITAEHYEYGYVDCYLSGYTKANGIDKVIECLNLKDYKTYAFGDGNNDLQMFDKVDIAIAMDNASKELKEKANIITKTNYDNGVYHALVKLRLI